MPIKQHKKKHTVKKYRELRESKTHNYTNKRISEICAGNSKIQADLELFPESKANFENVDNTYEKKKNMLVESLFRFSNEKEKKLIKSDFYDYINGAWIKLLRKENKPEYFVEYDNFRVTQNKVYIELIGYVKKFIKDNPKSEKAIRINNVYNSIRNDNRKSVKENCAKILSMLEIHIASGDMYDTLTNMNRNQIVSFGSPIVWSVMPNEKNVKKYISHLGVCQLGLYDYTLYIPCSGDGKDEKSMYKTKIKREYFKFIKTTLDACLGNNSYNPQDVWDVECDLLDAMGGCNNTKNSPDWYNLLTTKQLKDEYNFDWEYFSKKLGYKTTPPSVVVSDCSALKCVIALLRKSWNSPKWKTYFLFIYFKQVIRFENSYRKIYYNFYKKILEGQPTITPDDIYPIFALSLTFNTFLTAEYFKYNYNPLYISYVESLADGIRNTFIRKLKRNTWLTPTTRNYAIEKLKKIVFVIGKEPDMRYDPIFDYKEDDPWYNMYTLSRWKTSKFIELDGHDVIDIPQIDWQEMKLVGTQPYMVNAYYRPTSNTIYVPLAYLQPPFIDLTRNIEYNLAFIGYTLGHELSHSLDNSGSRFDLNGNLNNWWTPKDRKLYQAKIDNVVKQYEAFAKRDGIIFDATIGVGEDLADISGMSLVEEYLLHIQVFPDDSDLIKHAKIEALYAYIAEQGKQKIYKAALAAQLKMNPHPLEKYRCNCPLSRLALFRLVFDIKKGDGMWWENTDTIW